MTPPPNTPVDEVGARRAARQRPALAPDPPSRPGHITTRAHAVAIETVLETLVPTWSGETRATVAQTLADAVCRIVPISAQAMFAVAMDERNAARGVLTEVRALCQTGAESVPTAAILAILEEDE